MPNTDWGWGINVVKILLATAHLMPTAPTPIQHQSRPSHGELRYFVWTSDSGSPNLSPSSPESDLVMESSDVLCGLQIWVA